MDHKCEDCGRTLGDDGLHLDRQAEADCRYVLRRDMLQYRKERDDAKREAESLVRQVARLVGELDQARGHVTELQARCTEQALELRATDRRRMVREFHVTVLENQLPDRPTVPRDDVVRLWLAMAAEEFCELMAATFRPWPTEPWRLPHALRDIVTAVQTSPVSVRLPHVADGLVDLQYILEGFYLVLGLDSTALWAEVQASNLLKVGGPVRSDGKRLKPPGWVAPDIEGRLREMGWLGQ